MQVPLACNRRMLLDLAGSGAVKNLLAKCVQAPHIDGIVVTPPPTTSVAPSSSSAEQSRWFMAEVYPHDTSLKAYLRGSYPLVGDVEDVVQESYVRIWKARAAQPIRSAKGFLFQVARRLALDVLRHGRASPFAMGKDLDDVEAFSDDPNAADAATLGEKKSLLIDAVASLPPRYREIVIMRKLEDIPQKQVALRLGISERTVENLLSRGVRRCEEFLRRKGVNGLYEA